MKKVYSIIVAATLCSGAFAQTQRLVLAEEFTQASCGPCASQNPAFNTLLDANKSKVISIKYQTSWPGVDPMNKENASEVATRVTYYNVTGVPAAYMDGKVVSLPWNQTKINTQYAVTSPMSVDVAHNLSADYDSIFVTCKVKNLGSALTSAVVAHVVVIEEEIIFDKAPGTNGEKEFYNVMRKMLPNASGTTLPTSMPSGDSTILTFAIKLPSYIRNISKVAVVAFVQDKTTKVVSQTGYSPAQALALDASVKSISGLPLYQCTNTVTPEFELKNEGESTLTSAKINYSYDANTPASYDWTGNLAKGAVETVTLPTMTIATPGTRFVNVAVAEINGAADNNMKNNTKSSPVGIYNTSVAMPYVEDFQSTTFPSANFVINNFDNAETWNIGTGYGGFVTGSNQSAIKTLLYYTPTGGKDEIILSKLDLNSLASATAFINFDYAHAPVTANTEKDKLEIMSSTDCGTTWQSIYLLSGTEVFTANATNYVYNPTVADWRKMSIDISSLATQTDLMLKFVAISGKGNNMWIDNINFSKNVVLSAPTIAAPESSKVMAFPNPASVNTNLSLILEKSTVVNVDIYNTVGQKVSTQTFSHLALGVNTITVDLSKLNNGMYIMNVTADGVVSHSNISVEK